MGGSSQRKMGETEVINEGFLKGLNLNKGGSGLGQSQAGCQCGNSVGGTR